MPQHQFSLACDQLSRTVDADQFERLRWARHEGPMLAKLVELAHGALEGRDDIELTEEGSTSDVKRFVVKVHGNRVIAVALGLEGSQAAVRADAIDRSKYRLAEGEALIVDFAQLDAAWMAQAFQTLFGRVLN